MMIKRVGVIAALAMALCLGSAACARDTPQEAANKKLVLDFYAALAKPNLKDRIADVAKRYIAPNYIQHLADKENGRDAFIKYLSAPSLNEPGQPRRALPPATLLAIMADGDKVIQVTRRDMPDPTTGGTQPAFIWNMFRIEKGQLAEHWDALPPSIRPYSPSR